MKQPEYYTLSQCALMFHVSTESVRQWWKEGLLQTLPHKGKVLHITPESVEKLKGQKHLRRMLKAQQAHKMDTAELKKVYQQELAQLKKQCQLYAFLAKHQQLYVSIISTFFEKIMADTIPLQESQAMAMALAGYSMETICQRYGYSKEVMTRAITRGLSRLRQNIRSYTQMEDENRKLKAENANIRGHYRIMAQSFEDYKAKTGFPFFKYGIKEPARKPMPDIYMTKVKDTLKVASPIIDRLRNIGIHTMAQLVRLTKPQLSKYRGIGQKTVTEIDDALADLGLHFGTDLSVYDLPITN